MSLLMKGLMRRAAARVLEDKGFQVKELSGKGIRPGARLSAKRVRGSPFEVAVRTSRERSLGFSRLSDGSWRTLESVRWVVCVIPDEETSSDFAVFAFESEALKPWFDRALKALQDAKRAPELGMPIFIPLDDQPKKNVGHDLVGLKKAAIWSERVNPKELQEVPSESMEIFIDRVKREFAERINVDVSKVVVEFRVLG